MQRLKIDLDELWRLSVGWDLERVGFLMRLLRCVWESQEHLPENVEEVGKLSGWTGLNARIVRKHYDAEMRDALRRMVVHQRIRLSKEQRSEIYARCEGLCHHCGVAIDEAAFHVDHLAPVSKGGLSGTSNLVASCAPCNLSKGAR